MKILAYPFLALALCICLSCEKESIEETDVQTFLTAEQKVANLVKTPVVFQYALINEESGNANSWFITKKGEIRKLSGSHYILQYELYSENDLETMIELGTTVVGTITPEQLLKYYQLNYDVYRRGSSSQTSQSTSSRRELFRSYIPATSAAQGEGRTRNCQEGQLGYREAFEDVSQYLAVTLESNGKHHIKNTHENTDLILEWMRSLEVTIESPN